MARDMTERAVARDSRPHRQPPLIPSGRLGPYRRAGTCSRQLQNSDRRTVGYGDETGVSIATGSRPPAVETYPLPFARNMVKYLVIGLYTGQLEKPSAGPNGARHFKGGFANLTIYSWRSATKGSTRMARRVGT